ncbi:hypothetical protein CFE70_010351 [Pyrenophora teres f. teres 0-1]|uniref:Uncharacterized protein n=1 Tax=Pyrenophora teres f. teres (strain 0-1) TaxID=861557 RepID=E3RCN4_PYRTT|nr:hypothetical protein PTT_00728 [Pyrenophora teres f. teres 0-1]
MDPTPGQLIYQNPKEVIEDRLQDLDSVTDDEQAPTGIPRDVFKGPMDSWHGFNKEVSTFYANQHLQDAFARTSGMRIDVDAMKAPPYWADLNHTQVTEAKNTHFSLIHSAVNRMFTVAKALFHDATPTQTASLQSIPMTDDWRFVTTKMRRREENEEFEPNMLFKIPGNENNQMERVVGNIKFSGTCHIRQNWGNSDSQARGSMRHIFGQVARDMRERGLRFGFISIYEETVFLKIERQENDGSYTLFYSDIVRHTHRTVMGSDQQALDSISVRLGLLHLLHRATYEDVSTWSFNPDDIRSEEWACKELD